MARGALKQTHLWRSLSPPCWLVLAGKQRRFVIIPPLVRPSFPCLSPSFRSVRLSEERFHFPFSFPDHSLVVCFAHLLVYWALEYQVPPCLLNSALAAAIVVCLPYPFLPLPYQSSVCPRYLDILRRLLIIPQKHVSLGVLNRWVSGRLCTHALRRLLYLNKLFLLGVETKLYGYGLYLRHEVILPPPPYAGAHYLCWADTLFCRTGTVRLVIL